VRGFSLAVLFDRDAHVFCLELEHERVDRLSAERELKAESSRRHEAEMSLARKQEQLDARLRENVQLRADISALQRRLASVEERLFESAATTR
jgi:Tfp pilus assembly protein PilN